MTNLKTTLTALQIVADEIEKLQGVTQAQCIRDAAKMLEQQQERITALEEHALFISAKVLNDVIVGNQSAWIEWQHGNGAEAAMRWIHNGLWGPGNIPDEDAPYGKEAQAWHDANIAEPFPKCACGRPSNRISRGVGACCEEHLEQALKAKDGE